MNHIVSLEEAHKKLHDENVVFMDVQFTFGKSELGDSYYQKQHIPGAVYFHLDRDLSGPILEHGGRHPIPDASIFAKKLSLAGIDNDTEVFVYDNTGGATAARLWWLLKYFGHQKVSVLEHPLQKWVERGFEVTSEPSTPTSKVYIPKIQPNTTVSMENILQHLGSSERILIDARTNDVYSGEKKTKYPKIGHIPGAVNIFWEEVLNDQLAFKSPEELQAVFKHVPRDKEIVVYCGAGVTACANVLALYQLGYENVKLYVGSWGDWASYKHTPTEIEKKYNPHRI
ncbi:sulfurtransferase [Bacillus sp. 03113]|uniref:sulfurtransferase n=1 Tax=Bacillus sp. 03113 TaxID=2578211 RepID=UPI001141C0F1|nr:sulfurtransferase [Bacillus sp. 03113]